MSLAINRQMRSPMMLSVFLALGMLSTCASQASKTYTLAAATVPQPGGRPVSVSVETVNIARYLDRPQLVRRSSEVELGVSEFERWGEPLSSMIQRVLADDLRTRLPAGSTVTTSQTTTGKESVMVDLSVNRFESGMGGEVALNAQWQLHYRSGKRNARTQANISVHPTGTDTKAQIEAMSSALDQLAGHIAADLR